MRCPILAACARLSVAALLTSVTALAQTQLWIDQFGWPKWDACRAAAPDGSGGAFLAGFTTAPAIGLGNQRDILLARYDGAGVRLWSRRFGSSFEDSAFGAAADGLGGVFLTGTTWGGYGGALNSDGWIAHYDSSGAELWALPLPAGCDPLRASAEGAGGFFVCGTADAGTTPDSWAARFDPQGGLVWSATYPVWAQQMDSADLIVPDGSGGAFVAGSAGWSLSPWGIWLARVDAAGQVVWLERYSCGFKVVLRAMIPDGNGGVFLAGGTMCSFGGPAGGGEDDWLGRFGGDGKTLWLVQSDSPADEGLWTLAPDGEGGVLAAARVDLKSRLKRFDGAGKLLYTHTITDLTLIDVAFTFEDGAGGVFVGGSTEKPLVGPTAGSYDIWVARYDGACNSGTTYCVASSTSIPGCKASIHAVGSPTLSDPNAWTVSSGPVPGGNLGLLLFGSSGKANTPYGTLGGKLCVASPTFRTAPEPGGGDAGQCNGAYAFTLADLIAAAPVVTSGATLHAQVWARDPANQDGFLLSDGLQVVVCP